MGKDQIVVQLGAWVPTNLNGTANSYNGSMVKTLGESRARLGELIELASHGQDVLISVRGTVRAKLTGASGPAERDPGLVWAEELRALHVAAGRGTATSSQSILDELRSDRV